MMKKGLKRKSGRRIQLKLISALMCAAMLIAGLPFGAYALSEDIDAPYVEGEVIISVREDSAVLADGTQGKAEAGTVSIDFDAAGITGIEQLETYSEANVYVAKIDGDVKSTCRKLNKNKDIIAEPNYLMESCSYSIPAEISDSNNIYTTYQKKYFNDILNVPDAWKTYGATGKGVTVAIIDSGFNTKASEFPTNLWKNSKGTVGWNVHDNNDDISPIYKSDKSEFTTGTWMTQHGTNVAGVIGMAANGTACVGIAYNAKLMLLKAASYKDNSAISIDTADVVKAIDFARENKADIINLTLSTTSASSAFESAVNRAYDAGIAIIASVANSSKASSTSKSYPAAFENVIGVMALDNENPTKLMLQSNFDDSGNQTYYDIAAPGNKIVGCALTAGSLSFLSGASQASAITTGCAALYLEKYPDATVDDLYSAFRNFSADTVSSNSTVSSKTYKYRSLNAKKLLAYAPHVCSYQETIITAATCTTAGVKQLYCPGCGDKQTVTIPALGHNWNATYTVDVPATCQSTGLKSIHCSRCSATKNQQVIAKTAHTVVTDKGTPATCTQSGLTDGSHCSVCKEVLVKQTVIPAKGHSYESTVVEPTCQEGGYTTHTCKICKDTYTDSYTEKVAHDYIDEVVEPTCQEGGYTTHTCKFCKDTYTDSYTEKVDHDYIDDVVEPTCQKGGYTTHTCRFCKDTYTDSYTEKVDHDYIDTVTEPTCTEQGYTTHVCRFCKDTYTDSFTEKIPHSYTDAVVAPTCTEQGYTTHTCKCGDTYTDSYVPAKGHTDGEWKVTKPAAYMQAGEKALYCKECGEVIRTEVIPALEGRVASVSISDIEIKYKTTAVIKPEIKTEGEIKYTVKFETSDPKIVTVDKDGNITTVHKGTAKVTCIVTDEFGTVTKDTKTVNVKFSFGQWLIWILLFGFLWY